MNRLFKITVVSLLTLAGLLIVAFVLLRCVFRDEATAMLLDRQKKERVELLRSAAAYAAEPGADYRFTYRQDTARAREISRYFRLDTLLQADAPTWERALTLARFVARNIPHANQSVYPERRNAIGLWEYTREVEPAFNCRLHSIMLHELMLASGITNRFVTCLPADSLDNDCHVVNLVWLPERKKWAMLDSDMRAWVSSPDGTPLSLGEMRERYIAGEQTEIHWLLESRGEEYRSYYDAYWAKNLYWFESWDTTTYDRENGTQTEGRIIALVPPGYSGFQQTATGVRTSDAERFWAAPDSAE